MIPTELRKIAFAAGIVAFTGAGLNPGALAQQCDITEVRSENQADFSIRGSMNRHGEVVVSTNEFANDISRIFRWSTTNPNPELLLTAGGRNDFFSSASSAVITDPVDPGNSRILFAGRTDRDGLNVYLLDETDPQKSIPLLDLSGEQQVLSLGNIVVVDPDPDNPTFIYWQLSFNPDSGVTTTCIRSNVAVDPLDDPFDICEDGETLIFSPAAFGSELVFLRIEADGTQRIVNASNPNPAPGEAIFEVSADASLSGPSVNADGHVAFFATFPAENGSAAFDPATTGIYLFDGSSAELVVPYASGHSLQPAETTRTPRINSQGRIAFVAMEEINGDLVNGIYVYNPENDEANQVVRIEGDLGDPSFERVLFGYMSEPDDETLDRILYRARNDEDNSMTTLFLAHDCNVDPVQPDDCPWDLNNDGEVSVLDLLILLENFGSCANPANCPGDFNNDGLVNTLDLLILLENFGDCPEPAPACPWDLNDDNVVNTLDLLILLENFGDCADPADCPGDFNDDGVVNTLDLLILLENFGPCPTPAGACCLADGKCDDGGGQGITFAECMDQLGGVAFFSGEVCDDIDCAPNQRSAAT